MGWGRTFHRVGERVGEGGISWRLGWGDTSPGQASGGWDRDGLLAMMGQRLVAIVGQGQEATVGLEQVGGRGETRTGGHCGTWKGGYHETGTGQ